MAGRGGSRPAAYGPGGSSADDDYPGRRLGYPREGIGSIARSGPRVLALCIDWLISLVIATGLLGYRFGAAGGQTESFKPLAVFFVMNVVLLGTVGATIGFRALGIRLQRVDGRYAGVLPVLIRSALLCLAIPALIWDVDERGMHDRAAGTVLRRTR